MDLTEFSRFELRVDLSWRRTYAMEHSIRQSFEALLLIERKPSFSDGDKRQKDCYPEGGDRLM